MMTLHRKTTCAPRRDARAVALLALAACALACSLAVGAHSPAYAAGSSAETEIGVVFVEEPKAGGQGDGPAQPDPDQGGKQGQTGLPQQGGTDGLLAGGQNGSHWLLTTGDAAAAASGSLAIVAAIAALACLVAARRIGKEAHHVR